MRNTPKINVCTHFLRIIEFFVNSELYQYLGVKKKLIYLVNIFNQYTQPTVFVIQ